MQGRAAGESLTEDDPAAAGVAAEAGVGAGAGAGADPPVSDAGRKRAAVELIARQGPVLRQTARRYSLCADDADDAYQRGLEILLTKAPHDRARELLAWTRTVIKHEALAIRRNRERLLGTAPRPGGDEDDDWSARLPSGGIGPAERLERNEEVARSREALRTLKPAELRALTLLAEGYSYAEICEITGFSHTKVNRCLAEGRERFRRFVSDSESGGRCAEMGRLLSAFCDGEASPEEAVEVREHLRACGRCRATMRAYRAAPATVAALAPALSLSRSLLERTQELLLGIQSRLPGGGGAADASMTQVAAAGGAKGAGVAGLAKLAAVCAGTVGGAACVATGIAPSPADLVPSRSEAVRIERVSPRVIGESPPVPAEPEAAPVPAAVPGPGQEAGTKPRRSRPDGESATGAVEYSAQSAVETPPPAPAAAPPAPATSPPPAPPPAPPASQEPPAPSGSPAGEFGP